MHLNLSISLCIVLGGAPTADLSRIDSLLKDGDRAQRLLGLHRVEELGPPAGALSTRVALLLAIPDAELQLHATLALARIGNAALPSLEKKLDDADEMMRFHAVWALGLIGPPARPLLPRAIRALRDEQPEVRCKAAFALGRIAPDAPIALAALLPALRDADSDVRGAVQDALSRFGVLALEPLHRLVQAGAPPEEALWALNALAQRPGLFARIRPMVPDLCALHALAPEKFPHAWHYPLRQLLPRFGSDAAPRLLTLLDDQTNHRRYQICDILSDIAADLQKAGHEQETVHAIACKFRDRLLDEDSMVRQHAAWGLMGLGAAARFALPAFHECLTYPSDYLVADRARSAIKALDKDPLPPLKANLKTTEGKTQLSSAVAITRLENDGEAFAVLHAYLGHLDPGLRHQAAFALVTSRFTPHRPSVARDVTPVFREGIKDKSVQRRRESAQGLALIDDGRDAAVELVAALGDKDHQVRMHALPALTSLVKAEPERWLPQVLNRPRAELRALGWHWSTFLEHIGQPGLPHLIDLIKNEELVTVTCWSLRRLGNSARDAAPHLLALIRKHGLGNDSVGTDALAALLAIAGDGAFGDLLDWLQESDAALARTLDRRPAREPRKLLLSLLVSFKDDDSSSCFAAADALIKILPCLPKDAREDLEKDWMPAFRAALPRWKDALRSARAEERRAAAALLVRLRRFGYDLFTLTEPCLEMCREINVLLEDARADSDLLVRRQVRRAMLLDPRSGLTLFP